MIFKERGAFPTVTLFTVFLITTKKEPTLKNYQLIFCLMAAVPSLSFALGSLENPVAGSTESGIGVISGWHCTATNITATIDGASLGKAGSGTGRGDTASVCGRSNTGYSLLFNYNELTPGSHSLSLYADGQLLEIRQFNSVRSGDAPFVTGLVSRWSLPNFPSTGKTASIDWSQAKQSFVVTQITGSSPPPPPSPPPSTTPISSLNGSYSQRVKISYSGPQLTFSGKSCYGFPDENVNATFSITTNGNQAQITAGTPAGTCRYNFTAVSGNVSSGFNLNGSSACVSVDATHATDTYTNVTGTNIRKVNNLLYGSITTRTDYCTQTITL